MRRSAEFVAGLLARQPPVASFEELGGPFAGVLRVCRRHGFLAAEPEPNPTPSCPHCGSGAPVLLARRLLCGRCLSAVDPRHLSLWRFDVAAFLAWLGRAWNLDGDLRRIDDDFWQLGGRSDGGVATEYFFCRARPTDAARERLSAYRNAVLLRPLATADAAWFRGPSLTLPDVLTVTDDAIAAARPRESLGRHRAVRFDTGTGGLWAGDDLAGEVPVGTKEYHLLACLAESLDRYVAYADLKHEVLRRSGSRDTTEEATFCQKIKGRIKGKWIPEIDRFIATTNKGDGYRLRGHVERWLCGIDLNVAAADLLVDSKPLPQAGTT